MDYSVACECGKKHPVRTGDAGSRLSCACGRTVAVPSLSVLRREAGRIGASPELILTSMLKNRELPEGVFCVKCRAATDGIQNYHVTCERAQVKKERGYWLRTIYDLIQFRITWTTSEPADPEETGRDVYFQLPLRICPVCLADAARRHDVELLRLVPIYAHLFDKYPDATVSAL